MNSPRGIESISWFVGDRGVSATYLDCFSHVYAEVQGTQHNDMSLDTSYMCSVYHTCILQMRSQVNPKTAISTKN